MFWLPVLDAGNWRLPFTSPATVGLANAWLASTLDERQSRFCDVLLDEPGLVIWTLASVAKFRDAVPVGGIAELALWWSGEGAAAMAKAIEQADAATANTCSSRRCCVEPDSWTREVAEQFGELAVRAAARRKTLGAVPRSGSSSANILAAHPLAVRARSEPAVAEVAGADVAVAESARQSTEAELTATQWWATWLADWRQWGEFDETSYAQEADGPASASVPTWLVESPASTGPDSEIQLSLGEAARLRARWRDHAAAWVDLRALFAWMEGRTPSEAHYAARLQREKLASLRELAYGASHEINNPLATIATRAQALLRDEPDPERQRSLAVIASQAFRAHDMIADMMFVAKPPRFQRTRTNLRTMLTRLIAPWSERAERQGTRLVCQLPVDAELLADVDEEAIGMAVAALVANALEALGSGGHVVVEATGARRPHEAGLRNESVEGGSVSKPADAAQDDRNGVAIVVRDDGPGMPPRVRSHLFDPFFSGREAGRGLGFGLSKAWRIVTDHGGVLAVDGDSGRGATFTLWLPQARQSATGD